MFASRSGISPLIASVLLIAFALTAASLVGQWAPQLLQNIQQDTSSETDNLLTSIEAGIEIESTTYNPDSGNTSIIYRNTGKTKIENITITAQTGNNEFIQRRINQELSQAQINSIQLNTSQRPQQIRVDSTELSASDQIKNNSITINTDNQNTQPPQQNSKTIVYRTQGDYSEKDYSSVSYENPVDNPNIDQIKNNTPAGNTIQEDVSNYDTATVQYLHGAGGGNGFSGSHEGGSGGEVKNIEIDLSGINMIYIWVAGSGEYKSGGNGRYDGSASNENVGGSAGSTEISLQNTDSSESSDEPFIIGAGGGGGTGANSDYGGDGGARGGDYGYGVLGPGQSGKGQAPPLGGNGGSPKADGGPGDGAIDDQDRGIVSGGTTIKGGGSAAEIDGEIRIKYE
jgi:flagellin-like protein